MSDDDSFVMNIADDGAGTSGRRGNPRARTVARTSKKGWRGGGGRTREGGSDARDGRIKGKKRAREDSSARGGGGGTSSRGDGRRDGDGGRGKKSAAKAAAAAARTKTRPNDASRDGRGTGSRAKDDDDGFEVVRGDGANA